MELSHKISASYQVYKSEFHLYGQQQHQQQQKQIGFKGYLSPRSVELGWAELGWAKVDQYKARVV